VGTAVEAEAGASDTGHGRATGPPGFEGVALRMVIVAGAVVTVNGASRSNFISPIELGVGHWWGNQGPRTGAQHGEQQVRVSPHISVPPIIVPRPVREARSTVIDGEPLDMATLLTNPTIPAILDDSYADGRSGVRTTGSRQFLDHETDVVPLDCSPVVTENSSIVPTFKLKYHSISANL